MNQQHQRQKQKPKQNRLDKQESKSIESNEDLPKGGIPNINFQKVLGCGG